MAAEKPIADAELEVLKLLWDGEQPLTVREITESLYGSPTTSSTIGTVQKLIQRLEQKSYLRRDRRTYAHRFSAKVSQADVAGKQLEDLARKVADGSMVPFISHLVQAERLSEQEKEAIRRLLEE